MGQGEREGEVIIRSGVCDWAIFYPFDFILFCSCCWLKIVLGLD